MATSDPRIPDLSALLGEVAQTEVSVQDEPLGRFTHLLVGPTSQRVDWAVVTNSAGRRHVVPFDLLLVGSETVAVQIKATRVTSEHLLRLNRAPESVTAANIQQLIRPRLTHYARGDSGLDPDTYRRLALLLDRTDATENSPMVPILLPDGLVNTRAVESTRRLLRNQLAHSTGPEVDLVPTHKLLARFQSQGRETVAGSGRGLLRWLATAAAESDSQGELPLAKFPVILAAIMAPGAVDFPLPDHGSWEIAEGRVHGLQQGGSAEDLVYPGFRNADEDTEDNDDSADGGEEAAGRDDSKVGDPESIDGDTDNGDTGQRPAGPGSAGSRTLVAEPPESVEVGTRFSIEVYITTEATSAKHQSPLTGSLPAESTVTINATIPPAIAVEGALTQDVRIPTEGESERRLFTMTAKDIGSHEIRFTAWADGSYLGKVTVAIAVATEATGVTTQIEQALTWQLTPGEASLQIDYDKESQTFDFLFLGSKGYRKRAVSPPMVVDIVTQIGAVLPELDSYASDSSGLTPQLAADNMRNQGFDLWSRLVPADIQSAIVNRLPGRCDRSDEITQLTVYCDREVVPWELLYAQTAEGEDLGFLVDLFPVNRWVMGNRWGPQLSLTNPTFVLPQDQPTSATDEISAITATLRGHGRAERVLTYRQLQDALDHPAFGTLHFACHNFFSDEQGSQIVFPDQIFVPQSLTRLVRRRPLGPGRTLVFLNMCRSEGETPRYTSFETWAQWFLELGAAAVIGTSWAVRDTTASEFAQLVYQELAAGKTLGEAVKAGRKRASATLGDPTWLAYTVYGDPNATAELEETA